MIVHVFNSSLVSGPETLVIPTLAQYRDEPVTIIFLSETRCADRSDLPPAYARSFGLNVVEVPVRSRWDRKAVQELARVLAKLSPRIVHAHEVKASAYVAAGSNQNQVYKQVTTNHGVRAKKAPVLRFYEWIFTHWVMRRFDRVLTVCTSDRQLLIERGVPAAKIFVHLNGVDRPKVDFESRAKDRLEIHKSWKLAERGIPAHAVYLGVVGRLAPEKRHSFLLQSFHKLKAQSEVHLLVFGTGPLLDELTRESDRLGLSKRVHWMGYRNGIGAEMAGFDVLVSLSAAEGLPINLIEAGWAATSVFATAVDGNLDLIASPEVGNLVELTESPEQVADKLSKLISQPELMRSQGIRLQRRVEDVFSGKVWLRRLMELYLF